MKAHVSSPAKQLVAASTLIFVVGFCLRAGVNWYKGSLMIGEHSEDILIAINLAHLRRVCQCLWRYRAVGACGARVPVADQLLLPDVPRRVARFCGYFGFQFRARRPAVFLAALARPRVQTASAHRHSWRIPRRIAAHRSLGSDQR